MAKGGQPFGLRNLTLFRLNKDDATGVEYGEPIKLARGIKLELSPNFAEVALHSDDGAEVDASLLTHIDVTIDASQIDDAIRAKIFGHAYGTDGGMEVNRYDISPEYALAFRAPVWREGGATQFVYVVLYKGTFKEMSESFETIGKGSVTLQTHKGLVGTFSALDNNGAIMYRMRSDSPNASTEKLNKWFEKPQMK